MGGAQWAEIEDQEDLINFSLYTNKKISQNWIKENTHYIQTISNMVNIPCGILWFVELLPQLKTDVYLSWQKMTLNKWQAYATFV